MKISDIVSLHGIGSYAALARMAGVTRQAATQWSDELPPERVIRVSEASGWTYTPHFLRPDLYPHPNDGLPENMREA